MTTQDEWEELGRELERLRTLATIKAAPAARALGLSGTQLRNFERGRGDSGRPSAAYICDLAELYDADPMPLLRLVGYPERIVTSPTRPSTRVPSDLPPTVTITDEGVGANTGRHHVTIRADAIGVTLTVDYDGPEDRKRALAEAMWALGIDRGSNSAEGLPVPEVGDNPS